ncbi:MAG: alpha-xylosidase [Lachnospiraceae bacterium]|nr:alpha-xylosidase [Lachnospiraceae bacterium]
MKFSNGCWIFKEGVSCFSPKEVYSVNCGEEGKCTAVRLTLPTYFVTSRGDTLGNVNLTMEITSVAKEVFRIRTWHYRGQVREEPSFELFQKDLLPLEVKDGEEELRISSGSLTMVFQKNPFSLIFLRGKEVITKVTGRDLALMKTDWKGLPYDDSDAEDTYMRQMLSLGVGELVYGMGEHFTPFVKNGQSLDIWNADGGTSTEQAYKNIPFFLTNKGYGVFVNHPERVSFEVATEMVTKTQFSVKGGYLDYFFINGPTMKEVLTRYTDLTGKPSLPAPWTFGLWLSTSFTTNYDEKTVMSFIDGMFERGIPLRTFHFDCFWMKEFHWCDFTWDSRVFPDPKGLLSRIKAKGLNICVWINPYIGQDADIFEEGLEKGYFLKRTDGSIWQWDMWQPGMALVDFTNPEAWKWYQSKLSELLETGVDCFKTDFGERIPVKDVVWYDGSEPEKMHNYYTFLYNKCVYELLCEKRGKEDAVLFARSATAGGQRFPVHWGGDCWSDYESMEESLRGGLSLLMSGFGYWAHDIGGFENTSTADVYKRWVAFGLLSSHSRLHGSSSYRVPWVYDEEAVDVVRFFTRLKAKLMPYLYKEAIRTSETGIPMMRSMILEYTEDPACRYLDHQYMLGDSILVSPIFNDQGIAEYYLPEGKWTNFLNDEEYEGGRYIRERHSYLSIPMLVKENSVIVLGDSSDGPDYDYADNAEIRIYAPTDGCRIEETVYDMDKNPVIGIKVSRIASNVLVSVKTSKKCRIRLVNLCPEVFEVEKDTELNISIK